MKDFHLLLRLDFLLCVEGQGRGAFGNMLTYRVLTTFDITQTLESGTF